MDTTRRERREQGERIAAARAFVADLLAEALKKAADAEAVADLDRAAAHARIARAIERGVPEATWTGWTWEKGRQEADEKWQRARDHLKLVKLAVAVAESGMTETVDSIFPEG